MIVSELRAWAKADIVPSDLRNLVKVAAERIISLETRVSAAEANYDKAVKDPVVRSMREGGVNEGLAEFARGVKEALGDLWDTAPEGPSAADAIVGLKEKVKTIEASIDGYVVAFNGERDRANEMEKQRDEAAAHATDMEGIADGLSAVFEAKFHAAMRGDVLLGLNHHLSADVIEREQEAIAPAIEKLSPKWKAMNAVVKAAIDLRNSGYDGPWIGPVCEPLFSAANAYEKLILDEKKEDDDFLARRKVHASHQD